MADFLFFLPGRERMQVDGAEQRISCAVESVASVVFDGAALELNRNSDPEVLRLPV